MKKVLLTFFAALTVFAASAQIEKGTWIVGGDSNLSFVSNNEDAGDNSQFNLDVKGGYFVVDNLAVGLLVGFNKYNSNVDGAEDSDAWVRFGLFGRYYVNGKILLGLNYSAASQGDYSGSAIGLEAGYAIFLNKAVAIEPALNYAMYSGDDDGASFGLNVGISVFLGRGE